MRLRLRSAIAPLFLASSAAAARSAVLVAPRAASESSFSARLAPSDAALVIAQTLGFSQDFSVHAADPETIQAINAFAVSSASSVFNNDGRSSRRSFMLVIDGVKDPQKFVNPSLTKHITIPNPPSSDSTSTFLNDMDRRHQARHQLARIAIDVDSWCGLDTSDDLRQCVDNMATQWSFYHARYLQTFAKEHGVDSQVYKAKSASLADQLEQLITDHSLPFDLFVLLIPFEEPSWSFFGRSTPSQWTALYNTLARRQDVDHPAVAPNPDPASPVDPTQQDNAQPPLSNPQPAPQAPPSSPTVQPQQSDSNPPAGILPFCYSSIDVCKNTTNNCSGHGECREKFTAKFGDGTESRTCFACACEAETRDTSIGKKTTVWAGPACQKKDVSVPFWLLFGATVGLVGAVSFGLSTLYSMGNEDLPSVLSAGVGGASRSK